MTTSGRPSWLDRAVDEALAVCPTMQPWEVRVMLIAAAPTIENAVRETDSARQCLADSRGYRCMRAPGHQGWHTTLVDAGFESWSP